MVEIKILYKTEQLIVCEKPAGIMSEEGGLPNRLREQLGGEIYCVHRLDKPVGGLMVYARSAAAAAAMSGLITAGELTKEYLAIVPDKLEAADGTFTDLLYHDKAKNHSYIVKRARHGVREAQLRYEKLASQNGNALVRIRLLTGRSHQIRCQFAARAMPLVGDTKYGSRIRKHDLALYSHHLRFIDPFTGDLVDIISYPVGEFWDELLPDVTDRS